MDEVQKAQDELDQIAPSAPQEAPPQSLEDVIAGLKGFGIEEFEEILSIKSKNRLLRVKISNIPTTEEMLSVQSADEYKGYLWIKRVKCELLSRAITWIDGIDIRNLPPEQRFVPDPTDGNKVRDIQVVMRNVIMGWGQELTEVLWKVLMTHSQNIEDRMKAQFPDNATMTEVEQRLFEQAKKQLDEASKVIIEEQVAKLYDPNIVPDKLPEDN
jgi:hypothetical protein